MHFVAWKNNYRYLTISNFSLVYLLYWWGICLHTTGLRKVDQGISTKALSVSAWSFPSACGAHVDLVGYQHLAFHWTSDFRKHSSQLTSVLPSVHQCSYVVLSCCALVVWNQGCQTPTFFLCLLANKKLVAVQRGDACCFHQQMVVN